MNPLIKQTVIEVYCDAAADNGSQFHIAFSRLGLPWILAPIDGMRVEQIAGIEADSIYNVINVPDYTVASMVIEHLMLAGWNLTHAMVNDRQLHDSFEILKEIDLSVNLCNV